jgi:hypothetical protein
MCYSLYLSTSSPENLTRYNSELVRFEPLDKADSAGVDGDSLRALRNSHVWFVGSKAGCSCTFRHVVEDSVDFREPEDWCPEEEDEVKATIELYRAIASLRAAGHQVDCLDLWVDTPADQIREKPVNLAAVPEKAFRLLEMYHFVFE